MIEFQLIDDTEDVEVNLIDNTENVEIELIKEIDKYPDLKDLPSINNVTLTGNKTLHELGIQHEGDYVEKVEGKGLSTNDYTTPEKNKLASLENYDDTEVRQLIDGKQPKGDYALRNEIPTRNSQLQNDSGYITQETDPTVPNYVKSITQNNITNWNNKQEQLISGTNIKTINNTSILGSGNIEIEGGSGIKTLSISDYDYPTSNPTSIAGWLLEPNIYQVDGTNVAISKYPDEDYAIYYDTGDIFIKLTEASSDVTNMPPQYIYTQRKNNDFAYYVDKDQSSTILKVSDVVDSLTSVDPYKALSANQGKTLKDLISSLEDAISHSVISYQAISSLNSSSTETEIKQAFGGNEAFDKFLNNISAGKPLIIGGTSTGSNVINIASVTRVYIAGGRIQNIYIQFINTTGYALHEIELTYISGTWSATSQTSNLLLTSSNATITGKFKFDTLPESSIAPTKDDQLANKKYVDDTVNTIDLTNYVTNTDYATYDTGGVVKVSVGDHGLNMDNGTLKGVVKTYAQYGDMSSKGVVSKGTLENVIVGKNLAYKSDIPDVSNFITNTVNDLVNYYKKSETFTKQEVNDLISAITTMDIQVVQTLPTEDISTTTIYLVPKTTAGQNDAYDEYIYVSNAWEHIGSTDIDLSGYQTKIDSTHKLSSDLVDDTNNNHKFVSSTEKTTWNGKYTKPSGGIPKSDLTNDVQTSLGKADTALQSYTETDPTVPSYVKSITQANITSWNNKADAGDIPTALSDLSDDSTHRLVTDTEKTTWNGKANVSDIPKYYYGTCKTAAATRAKAVECEGFVLEEGATISVIFTYAQTYNGAPYLNVNETGNIVIQYKDGTNGIRYMWSAGEIIDFTYNGENWVCHGRALATTSYYGVTKLYTGAGSDSQAYASTPRSLYYFANYSIAPYYSASKTYAVGDKVRHTYYLYECTTAIETEEAWDEDHWKQIDTIQEQIDAINTTIGDIDTILTRLTTGSGV